MPKVAMQEKKCASAGDAETNNGLGGIRWPLEGRTAHLSWNLERLVHLR